METTWNKIVLGVKVFKGKTNNQSLHIQTCDEGIFTWASSLFLCNYAPTKTPLNFNHPSIYPGQAVKFKLLHLQYSISLYNANPSTVFADIVPTCPA